LIVVEISPALNNQLDAFHLPAHARNKEISGMTVTSASGA